MNTRICESFRDTHINRSQLSPSVAPTSIKTHCETFGTHIRVYVQWSFCDAIRKDQLKFPWHPILSVKFLWRIVIPWHPHRRDAVIILWHPHREDPDYFSWHSKRDALWILLWHSTILPWHPHLERRIVIPSKAPTFVRPSVKHPDQERLKWRAMRSLP